MDKCTDCTNGVIHGGEGPSYYCPVCSPEKYEQKEGHTSETEYGVVGRGIEDSAK